MYKSVEEASKSIGCTKFQTLRRVRIGFLNLGTLKLGEFRDLSSDEIATLYAPFRGTENMR